MLAINIVSINFFKISLLILEFRFPFKWLNSFAVAFLIDSISSPSGIDLMLGSLSHKKANICYAVLAQENSSL